MKTTNLQHGKAYVPHAWLLPLGTLAFAVGILLGRGADGWALPLAALAAAAAAAGVSRGRIRRGAALMTILCFGALMGWRAYHPDMPPEDTYLARGTVLEEVSCDDDGQVQTTLTGVTLNGVPQPDAYWSYYLKEDENLPEWLIPGAQIETTARVYHPSGQENPSGFDFREYLLQRGVVYGLYGGDGLKQTEDGFSLRGWAAGLRHDLTMRLFDVMGADAGAYAAAMLLGTKDFIPQDEHAAFRELGIAHILTVSGFHVGVLIGLLSLLMKPLPLRRGIRMALDAFILFAYCLLCGGNAPVVRAAFLLLWRKYAQLRHRQILPLHLLSASALLQLLINPTLLTGVSFQLTYGAMLGLILLFPRLKRLRAFSDPLAQKLWEGFCAALAVQLGLLFPQLYWFGQLPLLALLLNPVVMILVTGLITLYWLTLAALPIPGLREALGALSACATKSLLEAVAWLQQLPVTTLWTRQADVFTFCGCALLLLAASGLLPRRILPHRRKLLALSALLIVLILLPLPRNSTRYIQFSVGDADAAVLLDQDMTIVIDTGEDGVEIASYLHHQRRRVDAMFITHLHTDHALGIMAFLNQGVPVDVCYLPADAEVPVIDEEALPALAALRESGTEIRYLSRGDTVEIPSGVLTVLWPMADHVRPQHDANDVNLVLQADIAGVTMLLTGDLSGMHAAYCALPSDILKAPHHGSKVANSAELLDAVQPQLILQSNRLESRSLHLAELAGDIPLINTDEHGAAIIHFTGDGQFTVETGK